MYSLRLTPLPTYARILGKEANNMAKKIKKTAERYAIIANERYGLYVGVVVNHDLRTHTVEATQVRHVAQWYGKTGGITSLAAHGICGPRAGESRIGAPAPRAMLGGIVNVIDCTEVARASFEAAPQS